MKHENQSYRSMYFNSLLNINKQGNEIKCYLLISEKKTDPLQAVLEDLQGQPHL